MKKIGLWMLSAMLTFGLVACSSETPATNPEGENSANASEQTNQSENQVDTGSTLIVYYSATGNTEEAAQLIASQTGGDLFELEPAEPYTREDLNYNNENSRVSYEHSCQSSPFFIPLQKKAKIDRIQRQKRKKSNAASSSGSDRPPWSWRILSIKKTTATARANSSKRPCCFMPDIFPQRTTKPISLISSPPR